MRSSSNDGWIVQNTCGVMFNDFVHKHVCALCLTTYQHVYIYFVGGFYFLCCRHSIEDGSRGGISCNEYKLFAKFKILVATYIVCRSKMYWGSRGRLLLAPIYGTVWMLIRQLSPTIFELNLCEKVSHLIRSKDHSMQQFCWTQFR